MDKWTSEKRTMEKLFSGISGLPIKIKSADYSEDYNKNPIGYTSENGDVYLSYKNSLTMAVLEDEATAIRMGVGFHETLHKMRTNFKLTEKTIRKMPKYEGIIFHEIDNILEDAAIEEQATMVAGGMVIDCLEFAIAKTYELTDNLETINEPFDQFLAALIMFGDMGLLKGQFTSPIAKSIFRECAPYFAEGLKAVSSRKRNMCSLKIFELSKPLWEPLVKNCEEFEKFLSCHLELMKKMGVEENNGSGSGLEEYDEECDNNEENENKKGGKNNNSSQNESKRDKRRKYTIEQLNKNESEKCEDGQKHNAKDSSDNKKGHAEIKDNAGNKDNENNESNSNATDNKNRQDEENDKNGSNHNKDEHENCKDSADTDNDNKVTDDSGNNRNEQNEVESANNESESDDNNENGNASKIETEEYMLSEETIEKLSEEIKKTSEEDKEIKDDVLPKDFDIQLKMISQKNVACLNRIVTVSDKNKAMQIYNMIEENLHTGIRMMTNKMREIFRNDLEETVYKNSGRVDFNRVYGGKMTSRVFDKIKEPENKSDFSILLLIDESGSMYGEKAEAARKCAIALTEVFQNLNIPIYIIGFTADMNGYDVIHNHYVTWNSNKNNKCSLINIGGHCCNCDGYSIRYAGQIIKKRNSAHKLMIVISDGQPASSLYNTKNGIIDTINAIKEVKRYTNVLGVLIGNSDVDLLHKMYGNDFMHVSKVEDLYSTLARKISKLVDSEI